MSESDRTLADILRLTRADDVLTAGIKQRLELTAGSHKVADLARLDAFGLADFLNSADNTLVVDCDLLMVAERLLDAFERASRSSGATSAVTQKAVEQAIRVQVELPKNLDQLGLKELLELLKASPERADEILPHFYRDTLVQAAQVKTSRLAIVRDGQLDIDATYSHIRNLAKPFTQFSEPFDKSTQAITLEQATGSESRPYIHPFTGLPVEGPDELGFDFSQLPEELHCALLWAAGQHPAWPSSIDQFSMSEEVFATELPKRWQVILRAYQTAKANGDDRATYITRWYPKDVLRQLGTAALSGSRLPFGGEPERDEEWYFQQLVEYCEPRGIATHNNNRRVTQQIVPSVTTGNGTVWLESVIVLQSVSTGNAVIDGTAWTAPSARFHEGNASIGNNVRAARTYKDLYQRAIDFGIIKP